MAEWSVSSPFDFSEFDIWPLNFIDNSVRVLKTS